MHSKITFCFNQRNNSTLNFFLPPPKRKKVAISTFAVDIESGLVRQRTMSRNVSNSKQGRNYLYQPEMEAKDFSLTPKLPLVLGESPEENDVLEENNKRNEFF